jgi:hypothetical protein
MHWVLEELTWIALPMSAAIWRSCRASAKSFLCPPCLLSIAGQYSRFAADCYSSCGETQVTRTAGCHRPPMRDEGRQIDCSARCGVSPFPTMIACIVSPDVKRTRPAGTGHASRPKRCLSDIALRRAKPRQLPCLPLMIRPSCTDCSLRSSGHDAILAGLALGSQTCSSTVHVARCCDVAAYLLPGRIQVLCARSIAECSGR